MAKRNSEQISVVSGQADDGRVIDLPIDLLVVSPDETRKTIDQAALKELAASVADNGVIEPLIVRIAPPAAWKNLSDEFVCAHSCDTLYEIVAGQRRMLASRLAGKGTCPCIIRELSDDEAAERRTISNLQRENLPPIEEALGFSALLCAPGATVETVAAKLAKSPSYVGRRLKLLDAIEPVREALKAGAIEVGHAMELARLDEKQQIKHLSRLQCGYVANAAALNQFARDEDTEFDEGDGEVDDYERGVCKYCGCTEDDACRLDVGNCSWVNAEHTVCSNPDCVEEMGEDDDAVPVEHRWKPTDASVAELRREIARTTLMVLAGAPFPLEDELAPMACTECPKRSGNAKLLFDDCAQDTCTDRECFDAKVEVWIKYELDQADKGKQKLLMLSEGYGSNSAVIRSYSVVVVNERKPVVPCEYQEEAIWIDGDKAGHRTMICRDVKCKTHESRNFYSGPQSDPVKAKADRKKALEKVNAEKKYRKDLFEVLARAPITDTVCGVREDLDLEVAIYALGRAPGQYSKQITEALGWPEETLGWKGEKLLRETLGKLIPAERSRAVLLAANAGELAVNEFNSTGEPDDLEKLAELLGVDVKAVRASKAAKPKPAKPAKVKPAKKAAKRGGAGKRAKR